MKKTELEEQNALMKKALQEIHGRLKSPSEIHEAYYTIGYAIGIINTLNDKLNANFGTNLSIDE